MGVANVNGNVNNVITLLLNPGLSESIWSIFPQKIINGFYIKNDY